VVADGPEDSMAALGARLEAAGYQPEVRKPENWPVAVLSLPWGELVNRTEAAEAILGEAQP